MQETKDITEPIMEENMKETINNTSDGLIIGYSKSNEASVLIIGRKRKNQSAEIVNAFEGEEAVELYNKLLGK